jgi:hypothetical protein
MKKLIFVACVFLLLVSCKKTYQCECKDVKNWEDWNPIVTNIAIEDKKESDAKVICSSLSNDFGNGNYKTCKLK